MPQEYEVSVVCRNCGLQQQAKIPWGFRVQYGMCKRCGCKMLALVGTPKDYIHLHPVLSIASKWLSSVMK